VSLTDRASQAVEELMTLRQLLRDLAEWDSVHQLHWHEMKWEERAYTTIRRADPFWWEPEICEVVTVASETLPDWTPRRELFPMPSGFFLFARPIPLPPEDSALNTRVFDQPLRAVSWSFGLDGETVHCQGWTHISSGEIAWAGPGGQMYFGQKVEAQDWDAQTMVGFHRLPNGEVEYLEKPVRRAVKTLAVLGACLLFLEQQFAVSERRAPDRLARRRFEKANIEYPELRVIRLRKAHVDPAQKESGKVDWHVRWIVNGHWRQQWYASDQSHRPLWILPYLKGPADKPLKAPTASVFAVVR
jgi:hypothetical protein